MCRGGRLIVAFFAGTSERPDVPALVDDCLTLTADGTWVAWAHKAARPVGDRFRPLTGGEPYPRDAVAQCRRKGDHSAPHLGCTCGFHALSAPVPGAWPGRFDVALSGKILAFEWQTGGVLFRAARQTVIRVSRARDGQVWTPTSPGDPTGRLARLPRRDPRGAGPVRLRLPQTIPPVVKLDDDAGYCLVDARADAPTSERVLATV